MKTLIFPFLAFIFAVVAYFWPDMFVGFKPAITPLLMLIMLSMGITLSLEDFRQVARQKFALILGVVLQFLIMPAAAFLICLALGLEGDLLIGMMLVGTSAGGTASNVMSYLAKGDLALSVSMTLTSTLLSVVLMPFLTWLYIGQKIDVPVTNMLIDLVQITLLPLILGVILNKFLGKGVKRIEPFLPAVSIAVIVLIIAIVVALNNKRLHEVGFIVVIAVILHNGAGLFFGYVGAKIFGFSEKIARTIAIEVGMQNSGLSVALALKHFSGLSALPGAIFSIWHNISGSLLAGYWGSKTKNK